MNEDTFLDVEEHFDILLKALSPEDQRIYREARNTRIETGYRGRSFVLYSTDDIGPVGVDRLVIKAFTCNDDQGASFELESTDHGGVLRVGYTPVRLFDHPVLMWLPIHARVRWGAARSAIDRGSLAFPVAVRTQSRKTLRDPGAIYCETGASYSREFNITVAE